MIDAKDLADKFNATHKACKFVHWNDEAWYLELNGKRVATFSFVTDGLFTGFNNWRVWGIYNTNKHSYALTLNALNKKVRHILKNME